MAENINYPPEEPNVTPTITPGTTTLLPIQPTYPPNLPQNPTEGFTSDNYGLDTANILSVISPTVKPFEGEIIELQKRHYDQASTSELLDRGFSEIAKSRDKLTTDNFFNLYQELFYDLPKQGKKSHNFLIEESTRYIGGYEDPKDDKIDNLINRIVEIETAQIETPSEHPLFRNGTAIRYNKSLGIMQEGHLRSVSNGSGEGGTPSPYQQLKKVLGLKDASGKILPDEDSWTKVTEQTWNSLPKWPEGTRIDEVADWSLTLSQFNVDVSSITTLKENVKTSQLDQYEINFLIKELENKIPFLEITVEDGSTGSTGNIEYEPTDLLPFISPGNVDNEIKIYYIGGEYGEARALDPLSVMDSIIEKYEARNDKGIYDIADIFDGINRYGEHFKSSYIEDLYELGENLITEKATGQNSPFPEGIIIIYNFEQYRWQTKDGGAKKEWAKLITMENNISDNGSAENEIYRKQVKEIIEAKATELVILYSDYSTLSYIQNL